MAGQSAHPFTVIDNSIIYEYLPQIGVYGFTVYCVIKSHRNQKNGDCFPSYATIARLSGIHRSTVIVCVKQLRALNLLDPQWRFKDDGSHASNQYHFQAPDTCVPAKKSENVVQTEQCGRPERPPLVAQDDHPSRPERPELDEANKTKERTRETSALLPTEKQKTCQHPEPAIVHLSDNITICHHCYGLLDENLKLQEEDTPLTEEVCAA